MAKMTGAKYVAEFLQGYGVNAVFFVPTVLSKALASMDDMPIKRVLTHGEKAAAYMADGYARATGRPGVCAAQAIGSRQSRRRTARSIHGAQPGDRVDWRTSCATKSTNLIIRKSTTIRCSIKSPKPISRWMSPAGCPICCAKPFARPHPARRDL